ncbi:TPA: DNA-directed DNA polymerase II small subunit [archaeon]|uniref:DNA polymerase II small subunit n=1 Tax=Candidatus Naiadarchaeum limnaeum TaxID=2756139 RepID=A0A832URC5_9ARCH|nr:DNA-directed DNA polymerase II small subunit [Candidatus Naiadarchaeum limnaeum]
MSLTLGGFDSPKTQTGELKHELLKRILASRLQIAKNALELLAQHPNPNERVEQLILQLKESDEFLILPKHLAQAQPLKEAKQKTTRERVEIVANYASTKPLESIKDISKYFAMRFNQYKRYLQNRLKNVQSISNLKKINNEKVSVIGIISDRRKTHRGNIILKLEDLSGETTAIITNKELIPQAEEMLFDEVIGITGTINKGVIFVEEITVPDLPIKKELKTLENTVYAAFLSDVHVGSKKFLSDKFENMLAFINGKETGALIWEEQAELIDNLKYIFVAGDIVDGIGVYPGQEKELNIRDIFAQYKETAKFFEKIPESIQIIMCPGNHDYVRLAQPQPPIEKDVAPDLYELPNTTLISSPGIVKIRPQENNGLNVLLYHGTSIDTIVPQNPNLKDGYKHPEKVMLTLLKKRHLSPQYESGIVTAEFESDPLAIPEDIDIIHTGHVHSNGAVNYRGVTLINSGTWQDVTDFQKFLGHEPTPARVPLLNLKTRQIRLLEF